MPLKKNGKVLKKWHNVIGHKCHFLSEVQDGDLTLIAYKYWRAGKQRWEYELIPLWLLEYELSLLKDRKIEKSNSR